jgi:hypothetical protein
MLNSTPRTPNFVRFEGQLSSYGGASGLILTLIESGQNGLVVLPKIELHLENAVFTFVAHPHLHNKEAILDILERKRGKFKFLGLPVCHMFSYPAHDLIFENAHQPQEPEQPQLTAVVNLPDLKIALTYAKQIAPLQHWKIYSDGLYLAQPRFILRFKQAQQAPLA